MIGIYKITNKLNGKSYIGQSIHCGKRFDEHNKGKQLIDEVIQIEGVENFNFEILKEVNKKHLSYWEDYYIMKYNTMFPRGYNKKWNCNKEIRKNIEEQIKNDFIRKNSKKDLTEEEKILEFIRKNSMKLYAYLVCLANPCDEHNRIFKHKELNFTKIKEATGITNKTVKMYLYFLEQNYLIRFQGENEFNYIAENDYSNKTEYSKAVQEEAIRVWNLRTKNEKAAYYRIPVPSPFTKIPEITLKKLNQDYQATELEMKLYVLCCHYRDFCVEYKKKYKALTYEHIRDCFHITDDSRNNAQIRKALYFLKGTGLIDFTEGEYLNAKGARIPSFKLTDVSYYVDFNFEDFKKEDFIKEEDWSILKERFLKIDIANF